MVKSLISIYKRFVKEGKYSTALKALDKATELDPQNATYWNNKSIALANLRSARYEKALQAYDKAIELFHSTLRPGIIKAQHLLIWVDMKKQ